MSSLWARPLSRGLLWSGHLLEREKSPLDTQLLGYLIQAVPMYQCMILQTITLDAHLRRGSYGARNPSASDTDQGRLPSSCSPALYPLSPLRLSWLSRANVARPFESSSVRSTRPGPRGRNRSLNSRKSSASRSREEENCCAEDDEVGQVNRVKRMPRHLSEEARTAVTPENNRRATHAIGDGPCRVWR